MVGLLPDSSGFDSPPVHVGIGSEFDMHRDPSTMDIRVAIRRGAVSTIFKKSLERAVF